MQIQKQFNYSTFIISQGWRVILFFRFIIKKHTLHKSFFYTNKEILPYIHNILKAFSVIPTTNTSIVYYTPFKLIFNLNDLATHSNWYNVPTIVDVTISIGKFFLFLLSSNYIWQVSKLGKVTKVCVSYYPVHQIIMLYYLCFRKYLEINRFYNLQLLGDSLICQCKYTIKVWRFLVIYTTTYLFKQSSSI